MSRTALDGLPFDDVANDQLLEVIQDFSRLYFAEILGFCLMGNHFPIMVRMNPDSGFTDAQIKQRYVDFLDRIPSFRMTMSATIEGFRAGGIRGIEPFRTAATLSAIPLRFRDHRHQGLRGPEIPTVQGLVSVQARENSQADQRAERFVFDEAAE